MDSAFAEALWCDQEVTQHFGGAMTTEQARARLRAEGERKGRQEFNTGLCFYARQPSLPAVPDYGRGRWILTLSKLAFTCMRSAWGLRLGEEALRAVLEHGFESLGLKKIVAGHGIAHDNSRKLLERVGFEYTHNILWGPMQIEVCMWAITAEIWHESEAVRACQRERDFEQYAR